MRERLESATMDIPHLTILVVFAYTTALIIYVHMSKNIFLNSRSHQKLLTKIIDLAMLPCYNCSIPAYLIVVLFSQLDFEYIFHSQLIINLFGGAGSLPRPRNSEYYRDCVPMSETTNRIHVSGMIKTFVKSRVKKK